MAVEGVPASSAVGDVVAGVAVEGVAAGVAVEGVVVASAVGDVRSASRMGHVPAGVAVQQVVAVVAAQQVVATQTGDLVAAVEAHDHVPDGAADDHVVADGAGVRGGHAVALLRGRGRGQTLAVGAGQEGVDVVVVRRGTHVEAEGIEVRALAEAVAHDSDDRRAMAVVGHQRRAAVTLARPGRLRRLTRREARTDVERVVVVQRVERAAVGGGPLRHVGGLQVLGDGLPRSEEPPSGDDRQRPSGFEVGGSRRRLDRDRGCPDVGGHLDQPDVVDPEPGRVVGGRPPVLEAGHPGRVAEVRRPGGAAREDLGVGRSERAVGGGQDEAAVDDGATADPTGGVIFEVDEHVRGVLTGHRGLAVPDAGAHIAQIGEGGAIDLVATDVPADDSGEAGDLCRRCRVVLCCGRAGGREPPGQQACGEDDCASPLHPSHQRPLGVPRHLCAGREER